MKNRERIILKVTKAYPNNHFLVGEKNQEEVFARFNFHDIYPEDNIVLCGSYQRSKKWGRYFQVDYFREYLDETWQIKWLKCAKKLSDDLIVRHLVKEELKELKRDFNLYRKIRTAFQFLIKQGVPERTIAKVELEYRWKWEEIFKDPYLLLKYPHFSYEIIQDLIEKFKFIDNPTSKGAYLVHQMLTKANGNGHFYQPTNIIEKKLNRYNVALNDVEFSGEFIYSEDRLYLKEHLQIEKEIAKNILNRLKKEKEEVDKTIIEDWEKSTGFTLAKNQKEAVKMALEEGFCIVTGGPGVGKTTVCKCITDILGENHSILMVAPTGRAAKRANESTGLPTSTIHSLLRYDGMDFSKNKNNQIETDVLVIDESSMIDAPLLKALLDATPMNTKIIFVGDVDQLPSVGAGQTLKDMIESDVVPVTRLTEIFRQAADSPIITLAYAVNRSELPKLEDHEDLKYIETEEEELIYRKVIEIAEDLYKNNDIFDVQILIPMYKGPVGIDVINTELQKRINPDSESVKVGDFEIRKNDKVIQTKNVKEKGIYNGDVGIVTCASPSQIKVKFQGSDKETSYHPDEFYDLQLSYAITVHRSQGSEYKFVIIPTVNSYSIMLQKNLLYTAITRSKKKLWMLYQMSALQQAIRAESVPERCTTLKELLKTTA